MKLIPFALMLFSLNAVADWSPPPNPDPQAILRSAEEVSSRASQSFRWLPTTVTDQEKADATSQLAWFYDHADAIDASLSGVRESFALSAWQKLGEVYPPALAQLIAVRDDRVARVHETSGAANAFIDAANINRYLHDEASTVDLFVWLDQTDGRVARRVYATAEPALVRTHRYALCGKYLDADRALQSAQRTFEAMKKVPERLPAFVSVLGVPTVSDTADKGFSNQAATIVALLAVNGDAAHAQEISKRAKSTYDSPQFEDALQTALNGTVPEPWPSE
jgi:hypothetical protein